MSQRVVATRRAVSAARGMRTVVDGSLATTIQQLHQCGTVLSTPGAWDGPMAAEFRSEWTRTESAIKQMLHQLQTLQVTVPRIIDDIMRADSGTLTAVPAPSPAGYRVAGTSPLPAPPSHEELARRRAWWAGLTEEQRLQSLRTRPADVAYLATPDELHTAGYSSLRDVYARQTNADAGINPATWNPSRGLKANDANLQAAYAFYQHLWDSDHNLQWAGMARLAGAPVYGGLQDMYVLSQLPRDRLVQLAQAGSPEAAFVLQYGTHEVWWYEKQFLLMQKNIYDDLAWQHDAYEHGGIDAIRALADSGAINARTLPAWEDIGSGEPRRVARGNMVLLEREQQNILQPTYDEIRNHNGPEGRAFANLLSENTRSPVPGGAPFRDCGDFHVGMSLGNLEIGYPSSDVTRFPDRWHWVVSDMVPRYQALLNDPAAAQTLIDTPLRGRAGGYRMLPGLNVDGY